MLVTMARLFGVFAFTGHVRGIPANFFPSNKRESADPTTSLKSRLMGPNSRIQTIPCLPEPDDDRALLRLNDAQLGICCGAD